MKIVTKHDKKLMLIYPVMLIISVLLAYGIALSDKNKSKLPDIKNSSSHYPDEYSILDDKNAKESPNIEVISEAIEKARSKYISALIRVDKGDTTMAIKLFESSLDALNQLVSYPGIEQNTDFTELAQSIIEDYEALVQDIDKLDENSNFFIIRDLLFHEVETITLPQQNQQATTKITLPAKGATIPENLPAITIPLVDNEHVQKSLTFLTQDRGRKFFKKWLERSSRWFPMMKKIAAEENMPQEIIYLSMIESGLNPVAVSRAKAVGLWQFIRSTGEMYNLNKPASVWVDERRDPIKATRAAMQHLRDLYNELGDWHLALAAYNCGINGVNRAKKKTNLDNPDYWQVREFLPRETQHYVPLYIATAKIAMQSEAYGFSVDSLNFADEFLYDTFSVNEPVSLKALAKCANINVEELKILNPELLSGCTPPDLKEYKVRIPKGSADLFSIEFSKLKPEDKQPWVTHTVVRGETVSSIARLYGISRDIIIETNSLKSYRAKLKAGAKITIPVDQQYITQREESIASANKDKTLKPPSQPDSKKQNEQNLSSDSSNAKKLPDSIEYITHTVKEGETLYSICLSYNVQLIDLKMLNVLPSDNIVKVGQELKIPSDNSTSSNNVQITKIEKPKIIKHKVKNGETLARIADDYNVSIESISELNNLKNNKIFNGQTLKIETNSNKDYTKTKKNDLSSLKKTIHKVKKGENLGTIAARYGVTESDLKKWNPRSVAGSTVYFGTKLMVYQQPPAKGSSGTSQKKVNKLPKYYKIQTGDTYSSIARKFGVTIESLKKKNKKIDESGLQIGQRIRIQ
jgi:membrane-bound lytic murein transglycosylase D